MRKSLLTIIVLLFLASAYAKKDRLAGPVLPDVTLRGRALYEYDQAAWHATDAVRATQPLEESVGRYIARKSETGWTVVFGHLNESRNKFLISYEAIQGATLQVFTVKKMDPPIEDGTFYLAAAKAIDVALKDFKAPSRPYNVAVLPAVSNQLYVYLVPAQTEAGVYPLGGDVRYFMDSDGTTILEKRQLHKTILENSLKANGKGMTPAAGFHTHVLSDVPEDTDVFYVLNRHPLLPEFIGTLNKKLYEIHTDGAIFQGKL